MSSLNFLRVAATRHWHLRPALGLLMVTAVLAACGGGGAMGGGNGAPSVSNIIAETAQYGRNMLVTVNGGGLLDGVVLDGGGLCTGETTVSGGTDTTQRFNCRVATLGSLTVRVRTATGGRELASVRVTIPTPQVSIRVTQAANGNNPARSGIFVVELDPAAAPRTVNNFLDYVNGGFYTNTIFHRVVRDFVAQGGGYSNVPAIKPPTAPAIPSEASNGLKNLRGTIAMAREDNPDSATSQFFLNLADNPSLDFGSAQNPAGFTVFGRVVSGQEVVDEINLVETRPNLALELPDLPLTAVVIAAAVQVR